MDEVDDGFAFYKISFQWYSAIGVLITWITAIIVSYFTGGPDMSKFNIKLFPPFIQKMLPERYHLIELENADKKIFHENIINDMETKHELTELMLQSNEDSIQKE